MVTENVKKGQSASILSKNTQSMHTIANDFGTFLVEGFHLLALFAIGGATVWAAVVAFLGMVDTGHASIEDLLLLFIYLEIGAMVGIYFKTNHMPVRFLIYVAITALTRMLVNFISLDHTPSLGIVYVSGAILLLTLAILILRFGSYKYPSIPQSKQDPVIN